MSFSTRDTKAYRDDERSGHRTLDVKQREELVKNYLPATPNRARSSSRNRKKDAGRFGLRKFLKSQLYVFLYSFVHAIFSLYLRIRVAYHVVTNQILSILKYHHNTPDYIRRDVSTLSRLPRHLSVILTLEEGGRGVNVLEKLINEAAEVAAWCASAGIPRLSIYEKTGLLKKYMPQTHRALSRKLKAWFARHQGPVLSLSTRGETTIQTPSRDHFAQDQQTLEVILISEDDGREAMVDLTRVLAEMAQKDKISASDITLDVIDNELTEAVMPEPNLLISFEPYVDLQGYPPWPIRLTEIYCSPDNQGVGYQVFLRALRKYAQATFKLGK
ncbi:Decaprenyl diphosphate synthase-like protein [Biscogniauxia mediterranea]|nr:Decaprenyl diphosphate synthase-like protein [Biscogniauxia mediterranea]